MSLATRCFSQGLAPSSLNGLTVTYTVVGGNALRVAPNLNWTLNPTGSGRVAYTEAGFADVGPTGIVRGSYGRYVYAASGNVGQQVQTSESPGIPELALISRMTFSGSLEGAWTQSWGEASNYGTFTVAPSTPSVPLLNIATRLDLVPGQMVTPGFVVGGPIPRKVLVRAVGPGLIPFGVVGPLRSTTLSIFSGQTRVATNTGWTSLAADVATLQASFARVGAFAFSAGSLDSAVLLTLPPGNYTATAGAGTADERGEILVEIYFVP